jgi:hypothetical protein
MNPFEGLDENSAGNLEYILRSPAYTEYYEPLLKALERDLTLDIIDPGGQRKFNKPDDYLRGGILIIKALLEGPELALKDYHERRLDEQKALAAETKYADRAAAGSIGPMPIAPEDDF